MNSQTFLFFPHDIPEAILACAWRFWIYSHIIHYQIKVPSSLHFSFDFGTLEILSLVPRIGHHLRQRKILTQQEAPGKVPLPPCPLLCHPMNNLRFPGRKQICEQVTFNPMRILLPQSVIIFLGVDI
jgi:hypothetical protein